MTGTSARADLNEGPAGEDATESPRRRTPSARPRHTETVGESTDDDRARGEPSFEPLGDVIDTGLADLPGRERLVSSIRADLHADSVAAVVHVHGPPGIGKSAVVAAAVASAPLVVELDGRDLEPTPAGLLDQLARVLGCDPAAEEVARRLAAAPGAVVVVDAFERLHLLDAWLRNELLPSFPTTATVVLVARHAPSATWRSAPGWRGLVTSHVVGPLDDASSRRVLAHRGLDDDAVEWAISLSGGNPLALELAASVATNPDRKPVDPTGDVLDQLVGVVLDDLDGPSREAVHAAAVVRRITEPALAALIEGDASSQWTQLRHSALTDVSPSGVVLNDLVREVVLRDLHRRDPRRPERLRVTAAAQLTEAIEPGRADWADVADLLFLVPHPAVRAGFFPPADADHPVEPAGPTDHPAVAAIGATHLGSAELGLLHRWITAHPDAVVISRDPTGAVDAFGVRMVHGAIDRSISDDDPVAAAWSEDLRRRPLGEDEVSLAVRWTVARRCGESSGPDVAPLWVELKRFYLDLRPGLRRVYGSTSDWAEIEQVLGPVGFHPLCGPVRVGDDVRTPMVLDFGPGGVEAWLAGVTGVPMAEPEAPRGVVPGADPRLDRLSPRELEVLSHLADGLTNSQLAARLFISERTVNRHLSTIFTKLEVNNRVSAARIATEAGLTTPGR